jgi:hypothetical protein
MQILQIMSELYSFFYASVVDGSAISLYRDVKTMVYKYKHICKNSAIYPNMLYKTQIYRIASNTRINLPTNINRTAAISRKQGESRMIGMRVSL